MHYANDLIRRLSKGSSEDASSLARPWARPFSPRDPATLPRRHFVYGEHLIRGFTSLTVAPGGVGKSSLVLAETIAIATGRPIMGITPPERAPTWYFNGEDPPEEIEGRIYALLQHHGIPKEELEGWFYWGSGREAEVVIVRQDRKGALFVEPVVDQIIGFIRAKGIKVAALDPFLSTHQVPENDNMAMDRVAKTWAQVAHDGDCAVELVHHTGKSYGSEITVENARGASALLAAARHARTLSPITEQDAKRFGIDPLERSSYVRISVGKANLSKRLDAAAYFRLASVTLANGDQFQAAEPWVPTEVADALSPNDVARIKAVLRTPPQSSPNGWRADPQAEAWAGRAIMDAMGWDIEKSRNAAKAALERLIQEGHLEVRHQKLRSGREAPFISVAEES